MAHDASNGVVAWHPRPNWSENIPQLRHTTGPFPSTLPVHVWTFGEAGIGRMENMSHTPPEDGLQTHTVVSHRVAKRFFVLRRYFHLVLRGFVATLQLELV